MQDRKIKMFRAYRDPHIPPRAQNAFMMGNEPGQTKGSAHMTAIGIHLKAKYDSGERDFIIPYTNIEMFELEIEDNVVTLEKKPLGRPKGS